MPARTNPDWAVTRTITDILPGAGVQIILSYRTDRALAQAIQASIRVGPTARPVRLARQAAVPAAAPQGIVTGAGFDSCAAPSASTMTKWLASKYRSVGVYIGGVNRACAQASLTPSWLTAIQSQGWHYFPIYPGLQSSCVQASGDATIDSGHAAGEGTAAADDAVVQAQSLGIPKGTPLIYDMEAYSPACNSQVVTFLSAWDSELHARGYSAGVYESFTNIGALVSAARSMTEPDVIDYADWDGAATTTSSYMPGNMWTTHQRLHQYLGNNVETYGGVSLNIDSDELDVNMGGHPGPPGPGGHAGFRISVAINANRTAEWFARSASGALAHSWQQPVGSLTWSAVHTVGVSPTSLAGNPSVIAQANGGLTIFADDTSGQVQHAWQQAGFPNDWEWGKPLPAPPGQVLTGTDPAAPPPPPPPPLSSCPAATSRSTRPPHPAASRPSARSNRTTTPAGPPGAGSRAAARARRSRLRTPVTTSMSSAAPPRAPWRSTPGTAVPGAAGARWPAARRTSPGFPRLRSMARVRRSLSPLLRRAAWTTPGRAALAHGPGATRWPGPAPERPSRARQQRPPGPAARSRSTPSSPAGSQATSSSRARPGRLSGPAGLPSAASQAAACMAARLAGSTAQEHRR